jgi:fermentation-respiration switch protein FrsA (DUF1100 family)
MKQWAIFLILCLGSSLVYAQEIIGKWHGVTKPGVPRLVFNIIKTDKGLSSSMDSPDQDVKGMPTTETSFQNSILHIVVQAIGLEYTGTLGADNIIVGTLKQSGHSLPINLSREPIEHKKIVRPQEPEKPYPYYSEDLTFENKKAGITLAGTLTLPKKEGIFPAVVLISGSGPQNRDEELLGHKPFLILSDYLTTNGIAVLRYDDRGTALSTGDFKSATSADFATDVESAVDYLKTRKEIDRRKIGLIGHSEGGLIAPIVASHSKDIAFIVLLAGPGIPGKNILLLQQKLIGSSSGISKKNLQKKEVIYSKAFDMILKTTNLEKLKDDLEIYFKKNAHSIPSSDKTGLTDDDFSKQNAIGLSTPWMQYFLAYDPKSALTKVSIPVLALNGEKDLQVSPKENLSAIKKALIQGGNKNVTIKELPTLNHLFQESKTGSPDEYAVIDQTFSPNALKEILKWIQKQISQ